MEKKKQIKANVPCFNCKHYIEREELTYTAKNFMGHDVQNKAVYTNACKKREGDTPWYLSVVSDVQTGEFIPDIAECKDFEQKEGLTEEE